MCQHLPSNLEMFLCVSGTFKKYLVHGTLIEAVILTSPLPNVFAQPGLVLGTGTLPVGVSTPPKKFRNVPMCLRNLQKVFGAWSPNGSWDIELPTPPCICSTWPSFWALGLHPWMCQYLPSDPEIFLFVSGTSKKYLVHGSIIEAEILTSPLPNVFAQLGLVFGHWHSTHGCVNTSQVFRNVSLCLTNLQKVFSAWALIEAEILTSPFPMYFLNLAWFFGHWHSACRCVNTSQVI